MRGGHGQAGRAGLAYRADVGAAHAALRRGDGWADERRRAACGKLQRQLGVGGGAAVLVQNAHPHSSHVVGVALTQGVG